jgi:hypothetical protein
MDVRRMVMATQDRGFLTVQHDTLTDTADCILFHQELLMFGTHEIEDRGDYPPFTPVMETGSQPLLSDAVNADLYVAQYSNACPFISSQTESTTDMPGCESFSNGIIKQGLEVAVTEYVRRSRVLADRRLRARILKGDPDGAGYIIDVKVYNYSADECLDAGGCWAIDDAADGRAVSPAPDFGVKGDIDPTWDPYAHNATPYSVKDELNSADLVWLAQADALFLTPALLHIQHIYEDAGSASIDSFLSFLDSFVAAFMVVFVLFMGFVFTPQVKATNFDIQKKRAMLLYLPPQVSS